MKTKHFVNPEDYFEKQDVGKNGELFKITKETNEGNFRAIQIQREHLLNSEVLEVTFRKAPTNEDCFIQFSIKKTKLRYGEPVSWELVDFSIPKEFADLFFETFTQESKGKYTISYYMKGESKNSKTFNTFPEAKTFMEALELNPECESFKHERM